MATKYKVIERGNGLAGVTVGAEIYDAAAGDLLKIVQVGMGVHTDDNRGNYMTVMCEPADRDVTDMTDADFASMPEYIVEACEDEETEDKAYGLTFAEWIAATGRSRNGGRMDNPFYGEAQDHLRLAWRAGEDPAEYAE